MESSYIDTDSKKTAKTAVLNTIANVAALVVGVLIMPILSRVLSQEDIGLASTFIANRNIIVILATLAIYAFVNRAMIEFKNHKIDYICSITIYCIFSILLVFLIVLPFKNSIQNLLSLDDFLFYWLFISILSFALFSIADYFCIFQNFAKTVFAITLLTGPVSQIVSVVLGYLMPHDKFIGRVLGLDALYFLISIILIIWLLFFRKGKRFQIDYVSTSLRFTIPIIPHLLSQMVLTQCDLIMITSMLSAADSGIYSMGHTIGFLAFTVMSQIMVVWSPWVYRRLSEENYSAINNNFTIILLIGLLLSIGLLTISPEMVALFLPENYYLTNYVIPPLVASMFFQFCYIFVYDVEYYNKKSLQIAFASIIAAVVNLILNFIFIPRIGFYAACYTTLLSYFVLFFTNYLFARNLEVSKIYNMKIIFATIAFLVAYMAFSLMLVDLPLVRYLSFAIFSLVLIVWKKEDIRRVVNLFLGK